MLNNIIFGLLNITSIILVFIIIEIARYKNKNRIQWLALAIMVMIFTYCSGVLLQVYAKIILGHTLTGLLYYYAFGLNFTSAFYFSFIILFIRPETKLNWKFALLLIAPTIFYSLVLTNDYHHYFYVKYEIDHSVVFGKYMFITGIYSLVLHGIVFGYLIYYSINNFKLYFKHSLIIMISMSTAFIVNLLIMFKVVELPLYANAATASLGPLIIYFGILRYHFLEISPLSLKIILNAISDAFVVLDKNSIIIGYNQTFEKMFNAVETRKGIGFSKVCNQLEFSDYIHQASNEKRKVTFEKSIIFQDVHQYFMIDILPIINNRQVMGTVVLFKDITELNQKNLQLQQLLEEQRHHAETIEELAVANERNRMAGEVHDTLGHTITLIIALLETGLISINNNQIGEVKTKIKEALQYAKDGINELRRSILNLAPKSEMSSLLSTLKNLIADFSKSGLKIEFYTDEHEIYHQNNKTLINTLYRVCQEALTNSLRHGKSNHISIIMRTNNDILKISIIDDGYGCKEIKKGNGLSGMETKIKKLGGNILFGSDGEKGFNINIEIPVKGVQAND